MSTMFRRKQAREKHDPNHADITLAYMAGFWGTAALLSLVVVVLWR